LQLERQRYEKKRQAQLEADKQAASKPATAAGAGGDNVVVLAPPSRPAADSGADVGSAVDKPVDQAKKL